LRARGRNACSLADLVGGAPRQGGSRRNCTCAVRRICMRTSVWTAS
jgi:hypothetical protein